MDFEQYMRVALDLAVQAAEEGEIPVGCVIADGQGRVIGSGRNSRERSRSVTGHAEIMALEEACRARGDWRLDDCTLFVTLEPCPMCAGAMINARLGTLVYGAAEPLSGSAASILNLFEERYPGHTAIYGGILAEESRALLSEFFQKRRQPSSSGA
ncbi:MAG: nucleoside deaminase [Oscillospiraceae bacterium]|nr:nucleoside deaminase [Oscillospiraceae bacterium]